MGNYVQIRHARHQRRARFWVVQLVRACVAQSAEEEVAKQTARHISDAISKRVGEDVGVIYAAPGDAGHGDRVR